MSRVFFQRIWFFSTSVGFSQPPILSSIPILADKSCYHSALGIHSLQHTGQYPESHYQTIVMNINVSEWSHLSWSIQGVPQIASSWTVCLKLLPPELYATSCSIIPVILLHLVLYLLLLHYCFAQFPTVYHHYTKRNLRPARWGITIHRRIKMHTLREHLHSRKQPIFITHQMFASNSPPSCIILQMAYVLGIINEDVWQYQSGDQ